jgi:hypothetical protein
MPDLTKDTDRDYRDPKFSSWEVVSGQTVVKGSFCSLNTQAHGTAANRGRIEQYTGAAGEFPIGFHPSRKSGVVTGESPVLAGAHLDPIVTQLPVTGLTGDRTDIMLPVYATAGGTFTLTRPDAPNNRPIGVVLNFVSSSVAEVYLLGLAAQLAMSFAGASGSGTELWNMGTIGVGLAASGNLLTGLIAPFAGKFLSVFAVCVIGPTDADVDIDANLEIDTVNVTGGVIELVTADVAGDKKSGTAITAANVFSKGAVIDVDGVVNTAGTASDPGLYNLYAVCERTPSAGL